MDTEQIQQQIRARRAVIDQRIDLLTARGRAARQRLAPLALVAAAALAGAFALRTYGRRRRRLAARQRLRVVA